jgi:hypothetical protein
MCRRRSGGGAAPALPGPMSSDSHHLGLADKGQRQVDSAHFLLPHGERPHGAAAPRGRRRRLPRGPSAAREISRDFGSSAQEGLHQVRHLSGTFRRSSSSPTTRSWFRHWLETTDEPSDPSVGGDVLLPLRVPSS